MASDPLTQLHDLAGRLRVRGVPVTIDQLLACSQGVAELAPATRRELYLIGRASLVASRSHLSAFDAAFAEFAGPVADAPPDVPERQPQPRRPPRPAADGSSPQDDDGEPSESGAAASLLERLGRKDLRACSEDELAVIRRAIVEASFELPRRITRRTRPAVRGRPDLRRTVRRTLRRGDAEWQLERRARRRRPRRVVLLLDVSGSMAPYAHVLLAVGHVLARRGVPVETFCFATRVTRVTQALGARDPDAAMARAAEDVADWDGGTRIGESLRVFLARWGRSGAARGAVVAICSDGLERGDPALLAAQAARLARLAHRVLWLNPLRGEEGYEPVQRGIVAALPHADGHLPARDAVDVLTVLRALERAAA